VMDERNYLLNCSKEHTALFIACLERSHIGKTKTLLFYFIFLFFYKYH